MLTQFTVESEIHPDVSSHPNISVVPIPPHPSVLQTSNKVLFLFVAPLKVLFQVIALWWILAYHTKPAKWLLIQVCYSAIYICWSCLTCWAVEPAIHSNSGYCLTCLFLPTDQTCYRLA
jgi:beta-1,4-mannosyltransferase